MPSVARALDTVLSVDGFGRNCAFPLETTVGEVNDRNVKVNGRLVPVAGNRVTPHPRIGCVTEDPPLTTFSATVRIGGNGIGRIGDRYTPGNVITQGSENVFAGN